MLELAAIGVIKGACDTAIGAIPLVHDEKTRSRLIRLDTLLVKAEEQALLPEELIDARRLYQKVRVQALVAQNATVLEYLSNAKQLLDAQKPKFVDEQIDLIMLGVEAEAVLTQVHPTAQHSQNSTTCSTPDPAKTITFEEQPQMFADDASVLEKVFPSETVVPISPSRSSFDDPFIQDIASAVKPKTHAGWKKAGCWTLVLTASPVILLVPQVRRNLLTSKPKVTMETNGAKEATGYTFSVSLAR